MPDTTLTQSQALLELDSQHNSGLWSPNLVLTHGKGCRIWDADGKEYLDCLAGIAVASVGHGNARLAEALYEQAQKLIICSQAHANDTRVAFYQKLHSYVPQAWGLTRTFMANSGSEANEAAIKWAKVTTGRTHFVAAKRGFSGRTHGVLPLTHTKKYREPFGPFAHEATFVSYNNIDELRSAVTEETAAVFLEPVQGEGGIHPADEAFLQAAYAITREKGALLIMDEIQSGVGRTGAFFATEHYEGVRPDMVTLAKGIAAGFPLGVLLMREEVAKSMPAGGHGTTFGGNALASAAGCAVLDEIAERDLIRNAQEVGEYLQTQLRELQSDKIRTVRGKGLMIGIEFKSKVAPYIAALKDKGVLAINAGATVIRLVPPLIITQDEAALVVQRFDEVLREV